MKTKKIIQDDNIKNPIITIDENLTDYSQSKAVQKKLQLANEMLKKYGLPKEKLKE